MPRQPGFLSRGCEQSVADKTLSRGGLLQMVRRAAKLTDLRLDGG